ncbi:hypothetical protein [Nocardia xishanensis]|uniref:Tat pathway signal protein n=1 Tax=Nocardia xishanensis TaxID=238964 RepID=A0ABW7WTY1_9NOCA
MPLRLPAPPRAGRTFGSRVDRHTPQDTVAHHVPPVDRRTALRLAGGGVVGALALGAAAGCAEEPVHEPDPLAAQEVMARADAAAATAAIALAPQRQTALSTIANERTAHADALRAEIARVVGVYGDGTIPARKTRDRAAPFAATTTGPEATGTAVPPISPPSVEQLREQLARSRKSAADLAVTQSAYRAGLLASISAACAVHAGVLLA